MKIACSKKVEDCFDGSMVFSYEFDGSWTYEEICRLNKIGKLEYFPDFPRPFFRLIAETGLQIKGVQDEKSCTVIFPKTDKEVVKSGFESNYS